MKKYFLLASLVVIGLGIAVSQTNIDTTKVVSTKAAGTGSCSGPQNKMYTDCSRGKGLGSDCSTGGPDGDYMSSHYCQAPPDCCNYLGQYGSGACCWAERKYCLASQCANIKGSQDRCGAAYAGFEVWPLGCVGYNGGKPTQSPQPTSPQQPTQPVPTKKPRPTKIPTAVPTSPAGTRTPEPTNPPSEPTEPPSNPTTVPTIETQYNGGATFQGNGYNSNSNTTDTTASNTPGPATTTFSLPAIPLPHVDVVGPAAQTVQTVDDQLPRSLDFVEYLFSLTQSYDNRLENFINGHVSSIFKK